VDDSLETILRGIAEIAPNLHTAGTFSPRTLDAIVRLARRRHIRNSVETGSGASTLLLSHLSERHTVFAVDAGSGSVDNVRRSPLLRKNAVTFVEGPTQITLPRHSFTEKLQLVLIDGPHGYPFPDLEYYFLYPHLEAGALLILDDIHIPTVHNLFQFLRQDAMFQLEEAVQTTAFFTRTNAPTFDPLGDGWWQQNYNAVPLLRYTWKERIKSILPRSARRSLRGLGRDGCKVQILSPTDGQMVAAPGEVEGTLELPNDAHLWVLVHRKDFDGWWPQGSGALSLNGNRWSVSVRYGEPRDAGFEFEIAALVVGPATHELWMHQPPPVRLPLPQFVRGAAYRTVRKAPISS
jgi:predicted O-methyltransferase YrrM